MDFFYTTGKNDIICMEDLIHEIYTVGPNFTKANNFLWPFKVSSKLFYSHRHLGLGCIQLNERVVFTLNATDNRLRGRYWRASIIYTLMHPRHKYLYQCRVINRFLDGVNPRTPLFFYPWVFLIY